MRYLLTHHKISLVLCFLNTAEKHGYMKRNKFDHLHGSNKERPQQVKWIMACVFRHVSLKPSVTNRSKEVDQPGLLSVWRKVVRSQSRHMSTDAVPRKTHNVVQHIFTYKHRGYTPKQDDNNNKLHWVEMTSLIQREWKQSRSSSKRWSSDSKVLWTKWES